ncbi:hypothetical protein [Luteibacter sp.]|uniref:hypothetical protein n=1 Tax=Luteibacter sp. TaxID=1886636 RepID=UPI0025B9A932|nr:hypothetical protein [Luteibacter sp.]
MEALDPDCQIPRIKAFEDQQTLIDVKSLYKTFHTGDDDHFRERDLPKLVRMRPDLAIAKGRELIENVLTRSGLALRQGLIALRDASLLITPEVAASLVRFRRDRFPDLSIDMEDSERKFQSWLFLMLAFPHLCGDDQLLALMDPAVDTSFPIQMMPSFKPPTPGHLERVLDEALSKKSREQCLVAGFLAQINIQPPRSMAKFIEHLLAGDDRLFGILLLIKHGDLDRISTFSRSAWSAKNEIHDAIAFFGSLALIEAVRKQLIAADDIATRITVESWGYLAQSGADGARTVIRLVGEFIQRASESDVARPVIDIELQARPGYWPRRLHDVSRRKSKDNEDIISSGDLADELINHRRRSDEDRNEFLCIMDGLVQKDVELAIRPLLPQDMDAIANASPKTMDAWATSLLDISRERKPLTYTLAIFVAIQIAGDDDEKAMALLDSYRTTEPIASVVIGWPEYSPIAKLVWGAGAGGAWRELRRQRLRLAKNDHELFLEAVAAEAEGASAVLLELVDELLSDMHPSHQARGLMLLGFMDTAGSSKSRIDAWSESHGLPGQAHRAALRAWQRNKWAHHWFTKMVSADTDEEAWCHQVLFLECVDARIEHWGHGFAGGASKHHRLTGGLENTIKNRISQQKERRMSNLFGSPAPRDEFLRRRGELA